MAENADWLILTPQNLGFAVYGPTRDVLVTIDPGAWGQYLPRPVALRLSATEARALAEMLRKKADEAEAGRSQDPQDAGGG